MRIKHLLWVITGIVLLALTGGIAPTATAQTGEDWRCVQVNGTVDLNIRSGPGIGQPTLDTRAPGEQMEANFARRQSGVSYDWLPVRYNSIQGWAATTRIELCPSDAAQGPDTEQEPNAITGLNQDNTLDRYEIDIVARRVVLVANIQRNRTVATGTGTIISADGQIVTNAHVIEDADKVGIALLENINDPPQFQYLAEVLSYDEEIDVALLAIRTDLDGYRVQTPLDLPFIPTTMDADQVFRGDMVYIFGFPGIGDDYLVVTSGSIVSVENGTVAGRRLPVWYRTDAEIAPGNSGGLAVNGNGQFMGIPTFVHSESETGGRLGGIRPAEVALLAIETESALAAASSVGLPEPPAVTETVNIDLDTVELTHGSVQDAEAGISFHAALTIYGAEGENATLSARFFHDDMPSTPVINFAAPSEYRDEGGVVHATVLITPCCEETVYDDLRLFIPYSALGLTTPGTYPLKIALHIASENGAWRRLLSWEFITLTVW